MTIEQQIISFFGWCSLINIALLFLAFFIVTLMRSQVSRLHAHLFGLDENDIPALYFEYLGHYKLMILIFNLVPYVAMKIIQ